MSEFTKTLVVDADGSGDYKYINQATLALASTGGTIIVEQGTYTIDGDFDDSDPTDIIDQRTILVPSNVTIIGRGYAVIEVESNDTGGVSAFYAEDEDNICISGFKIVITGTNHTYDQHLIYMNNVNNSVIEKLYITDESTLGVLEDSVAAICFNGTGGACTGNVISQCTIESFGQEYNGANNYGYGILFISAQTEEAHSIESAHFNCKGNIIKNNFTRRTTNVNAA